MIDRIRQNIQNRLEQLLAEADRLRHALAELGTSDGADGRGSRIGSRLGSSPPPARSASPAGTAPSSGTAARGSSGSRGTRRTTGTSWSGQKSGPGRTSGRGRASSPEGRSGSRGAAAARSRGRGPATTRNASGNTKRAVLEALAEADGKPLTAGEVASSTGLGRPSVSTTLSKLAKNGEVAKAERGYQLAAAGHEAGAES